nr:MAG TPA: hypothetical protein [Caudoviricetes sp.]
MESTGEINSQLFLVFATRLYKLTDRDIRRVYISIPAIFISFHK